MPRQSSAHGDDQIKSLLETVERLRRDKFPHLDTDLVCELLQLHAAGQTADAALARAVEQAVERRLAKEA